MIWPLRIFFRLAAAVPVLASLTTIGVPAYAASVAGRVELRDSKDPSVLRIIKSDETRARLDAMGTFAAGSSPEEFDAFIASETTKWGKVIRDAGVKAD